MTPSSWLNRQEVDGGTFHLEALERDWLAMEYYDFGFGHVELEVILRGFPGSLDGKASAYNVGDLGSIPGSGRSPGGGNGNQSSVHAWKIPWTKEPGGLQSMRLQRVGHD